MLASLMRLARPANLLAIALFAAACGAPPPRPPEAPAAAVARYDAVDWARAGDETVDVLRRYLRVDTTNPPGNELRGARFMADVLAKEGIEHRVIEYAPGRGNLIAKLPGSGKERPLCLVSHIDVVTAEADKWPKDKGPLSGALDDKGDIWGRGALDMKGLGALELMTMVLLKRARVPLKRDVFLLAVGGEETDSSGIQHVVDHHWGEIGCSHSVNEGGLGIKDLLVEGQTVYTISVAEKGVLWLKMTAHGESGHGSTPVPGRAPERLLRAIARLEARHEDPIVHPSLYELASRIGDDAGGFKGFVLRRPWLVDAFVVGKLMESPPAKATLFNTVNVTGFEGRNEPNVVPSAVSAILDCRVRPGTRPVDLFVELRDVVDDENVSFELLEQMSANESTWDDPFFRALARHAVDGRPHVVAGPALSPGYTDSLYLRLKGVRAYGFTPFEVTQEEMKGFHGRDERVSAANVKRGVRALYRAVLDVSAE